VGNSQIPGQSDVVDPLWRRVLNDRFTILEPIGSGGMGKVYKAVQAPLDRVVALKVLNPQYANGKDPEFRKRFFLEASLTSRLRHPNTITVIDYGQTPDGIFYIAMEYLEGQTLSQLLAKSGLLRWTRCLNISQQICRSLREAHKLGVIHRDLKPANVMLISEDHETDLVKVLDFGLVKSFVSEQDKRAAPVPPSPEASTNGSSNPEVTDAGVFLGSPQYMAPEQARHRSDQRSDIYSLGATCYHMLAGRPPFWAKDSVEVIFKHINEPVPPLRSARADLDVPAEFEAVVMKCLEKQPSHRFQSMDELLDAIRRVAMATGNSGIFVTGTMAGPASTHANTPPPMPMSAVPAAAPKQENTLAIEISVVSAPEAHPTPKPQLAPLPVPPPRTPPTPARASPPAAPWYQNRKHLYLAAGAGALLILMVVAIPVARRRPAAPTPAPKVESVTKSVPPVEVAPVPEPTADKSPSAVAESPQPAPQPVKFRVSTEPSGATVSLGGQVLGTTPLSFNLPGNASGVATAQLLLTLKGYHSMAVTTGGSGEVVLTQKLQVRPLGRMGSAAPELRETVVEKPAITVAVPESRKQEQETRVAFAKPVASIEPPKNSATSPVEVPVPAPPQRAAEPVAELSSSAGPIEFTGAMMPPVKVSGPDPEYTQRALDHEAEGLMVVRCVVTTEGMVHTCRALQSVPFMERAVIDALQRRRYKPATLQGRPVDVYYTFRITLKLPR
jgi:TonB family protein